jgi:F-box domain
LRLGIVFKGGGECGCGKSSQISEHPLLVPNTGTLPYFLLSFHNDTPPENIWATVPPSRLSATTWSATTMNMVPPPRFLTLSPELLVQIISYLSFKDIISCEASCRHLNSVVKSSVLLKYLKEAGRTGVYDPLDAGFTFPERFERLRLWQKNWEDLEMPETSARITFDLDIWSPLIGSLHNGHLIVTDADPAVYASSDISSLPGARPARSIELGNLTLIREGLLHVFAFADEYDLVAIVSTCVSSQT